jgi:hypothetical protein
MLMVVEDSELDSERVQRTRERGDRAVAAALDVDLLALEAQPGSDAVAASLASCRYETSSYGSVTDR